jgi:hypothetical protein
MALEIECYLAIEESGEVSTLEDSNLVISREIL